MVRNRIISPNLLSKVKNVLTERHFNEQQINKVIPRLDEELIKEPVYLEEIVDTWFNIMCSHPDPNNIMSKEDSKIMAVPKPPKDSFFSQVDIDMTNILSNIEPDLLRMKPEKVIERHQKIGHLRIAQTHLDHWRILFHSARGFYLQDWREVLKKIYYLEQNVLDLLYDKKEQKEMTVHPITRSAAILESDFDHIRTRYLFAERSGYSSLSHLFPVQTALNKPTLADLILSSNKQYLNTFAPYCSMEEYYTFSNLIKNETIDESDAEIVERLAELNTL